MPVVVGSCERAGREFLRHSQGASVPPLAIAFIVGHGVDVFFSFLEGLIQAFTQSKSTPSPAAALASKP